MTRRPVDLFEKELLKGKWEVNLHTPTKFGEDPSKDLGVHREQTNKHTNKRCSNYSVIYHVCICFRCDRNHPYLYRCVDHSQSCSEEWRYHWWTVQRLEYELDQRTNSRRNEFYNIWHYQGKPTKVAHVSRRRPIEAAGLFKMPYCDMV